MSLEDIFPMLVAIIVLFVFIAFVYGIVGNNLEQRRVEATYETAVSLSDTLYSRSVFVYANKSGLFDSSKLDEYSSLYDELSSMYGVAGYGFSIEVNDLAEPARHWTYAPDKIGANAPEIAYPVAVRYSAGKINEGMLKVRVWRN